MAQQNLSWKKLIEEDEARKKDFEEVGKVQFMPFSGERYKVEILGNEIEPTKIISQDGSAYDGYAVKVRVNGEKTEKVWKVFKNTATDIARALSKHPDRVIEVTRPKGQKNPVIS